MIKILTFDQDVIILTLHCRGKDCNCTKNKRVIYRDSFFGGGGGWGGTSNLIFHHHAPINAVQLTFYALKLRRNVVRKGCCYLISQQFKMSTKLGSGLMESLKVLLNKPESKEVTNEGTFQGFFLQYNAKGGGWLDIRMQSKEKTS